MLLFKYERSGHCYGTRQTWRKILPRWNSMGYVPFPKQHASFTNVQWLPSFRWNFFQRFFFFLVVFLLSSGFFIHSLTKPHPVKLSFVQFPVYWLIKLTRTNLANIYKPVGATNIARRFPKPSPTWNAKGEGLVRE